jgi:hypothetical protein
LFYNILYALIFVTSTKLLYDYLVWFYNTLKILNKWYI